MVAMAVRSEDSFSEASSVSDFAWSDEEETAVVARTEETVVAGREEVAVVASGTWLRQAEVWRRQVTQLVAFRPPGPPGCPPGDPVPGLPPAERPAL